MQKNHHFNAYLRCVCGSVDIDFHSSCSHLTYAMSSFSHDLMFRQTDSSRRRKERRKFVLAAVEPYVHHAAGYVTTTTTIALISHENSNNMLAFSFAFLFSSQTKERRDYGRACELKKQKLDASRVGRGRHLLVRPTHNEDQRRQAANVAVELSSRLPIGADLAHDLHDRREYKIRYMTYATHRRKVRPSEGCHLALNIEVLS